MVHNPLKLTMSSSWSLLLYAGFGGLVLLFLVGILGSSFEIQEFKNNKKKKCKIKKCCASSWSPIPWFLPYHPHRHCCEMQSFLDLFSVFFFGYFFLPLQHRKLGINTSQQKNRFISLTQFVQDVPLSQIHRHCLPHHSERYQSRFGTPAFRYLCLSLSMRNEKTNCGVRDLCA
jgi:hypothetical protein